MVVVTNKVRLLLNVYFIIVLSLLFSTTPGPSSQEEGTTGSVFSSIILVFSLSTNR